MKKIGLLACSAHKLGKDTPEKLFKAQDIYTGNTFRLAKTAGLKKFGCEDYHILSAKFDLLDKDDEIAYYDMYLGHQKTAYKKEWAEKVLAKLKEKYDLDDTLFYIFGGQDYYRGLLPYLNCVVFSYISSNMINLNDATEYHKGIKQ